MTVREWFRVARGAMWATGSLTAAASEIDRTAYLIDFSNNYPPPIYIRAGRGYGWAVDDLLERRNARTQAAETLVVALRVTYYAAGLARPGTWEAVERDDQVRRRDLFLGLGE